MAAEEVADLRERKAALLIESDLNRQVLRLETEQIELRLNHWAHTAYRASSALKWLAPLGGIFLAKKFRKPFVGLGLSLGLQAVRSLVGILSRR